MPAATDGESSSPSKTEEDHRPDPFEVASMAKALNEYFGEGTYNLDQFVRETFFTKC